MEFITNIFARMEAAITDIFAKMDEALIGFCEKTFQGYLKPFFGIFDKLLTPIEQPFFTISAVVFFVLPMLWVGFYLKESYVNEGRPKKIWYTDLRIWTVVSMLPHVFVYFYFH